LMGQTDIRTTMQVYNHVDSERVARELNRISVHQFTPKITPICSEVM
jgi:hypothetical protein